MECPETWKKPCLSAWVDAGRLFFARDLLFTESPMCSRRLSGIAIIITLLPRPVKWLCKILRGKDSQQGDGERGLVLGGVAKSGGEDGNPLPDARPAVGLSGGANGGEQQVGGVDDQSPQHDALQVEGV